MCVCLVVCLCLVVCVCACRRACVCVCGFATLLLLSIHIGIRIHHNHRPYETRLKSVEWSFDTRIRSLILSLILHGAWSFVKPIKMKKNILPG